MPEAEGPPPGSELVFYQTEDGQSRLQVRLEGSTVWLTQRLLAELYQVAVPTINEHLTNIFDEEELEPGATIRKFRIVQTGQERKLKGPRATRRSMCRPEGETPKRRESALVRNIVAAGGLSPSPTIKQHLTVQVQRSASDAETTAERLGPGKRSKGREP